jgi:Fur family ferric uptake transcriptional regulator
VSNTLNKSHDLLGQAGLRRTPVRKSVLDILSQDKQPLTVPQILERLPAGTDVITLYRTLKTFTEKKLVHKVRGDDQAWRYGMGSAKETGRHGHAHFVCDDCGTVECLDDTPVPSPALKQSKARPGYRVSYSELLVHGTCPDCRH